ncbi:hypothetical protein [Salinigranum sp. GCM10025319]|uniref:hypothetical protein n=1 Tax=Salinigranum sp. GCM10025319 TaxID=3252687 RepID=UPI003619324F
MTDRIDDLRDVFARLGGEGRFTEPQQQARGSVRSDAAIDRDLRALVAELRKRNGLRTTLSDDDLVRIIRGFYAGRSDRDLATDLDVSPGTVFRARLALHLFRTSDVPTEFDPVIRRLRAGDAVADVAAALDVPRRAVDRVRRVLDAREAARRVNYRYTGEFADLLDGDTARIELDRQVWDDRRALVDAHDD